MNILITGAFGFVGTNLSAYLAERGYEVWALDVSGVVGNRQSAIGSGEMSRKDAKTQKSAYTRRFNWEELERIPWNEVDAVIHLAGKAHDTRNTSDAKSYFDVNVGLTRKVLDVFSRQGAKAQSGEKKFILFSSVKAVADRVEGVLTEEAVPDPKTAYGQSKLEAEGEVLKFESSKVRESGETTANKANQANGEKEVLKFGSSKVRESETANQEEQTDENHFRTLELSNFRTYILRPCMIHGPGNKGNLNLLYGVVKKGIPWPLGAFENRRSFTSIGNLCAVTDALLKGDSASGIYQMADDEALSTNELVALMSEVMGRRARIWRISTGLIRAAARLGDVLRLPLNSERLKKLTESYIVSNDKLKAALGWEKMPVSSRDGMTKTFESFSRKGAKTQS